MQFEKDIQRQDNLEMASYRIESWRGVAPKKSTNKYQIRQHINDD